MICISEPNAAETSVYQEGKIHIYKYDSILDRYILDKTLRSKLSKIGYIMRVSPNMDRIATYGYRRGTEDLELVIFYDLDSISPKEVSIKSNVYDMTFLGQTNSLFVEESYLIQDFNKDRTFYVLEDVNGCPNILTKTIIPNMIFSGSQQMFKLKSFGYDYLMFYSETSVYIIQIKNYQMKFISGRPKARGSDVLVSDQGNLCLMYIIENGQIVFYLSW
jgi:hypothetical protein